MSQPHSWRACLAGFFFNMRSLRQPPGRSPVSLSLEALEDRSLLSASSPLGEAGLVLAPQLSVLSSAGQQGKMPDATTGPSGFHPDQIRTAYGFNNISGLSSSTYNTQAGSGQVIAIVDAYYDPKIQSDLTTFDTQFKLPDPSLTVVGVNSQTGAVYTTPGDVAANVPQSASWAMETSLDVEWAHAIAPAAKIVLVESSAGNVVGDMVNAVNYAASYVDPSTSQPVSVVSMSWGQPETQFPTSAGLGESDYDKLFGFNRAGVTFVASSGDYGAPPSYPAVSPYVVGVGGTHLTLTSSNTINTETAWGHGSLTPMFGGSGGGISKYELQPSGLPTTYSNGTHTGIADPIITTSLGTGAARMSPDVAYDGDPNTGFAIYDSVPYNGATGWSVVGGTSAGAPQWAALIAIADQQRASAGHGPLSSSDTLTALSQAAKTTGYGTTSSPFHDVKTGSNGTYSAGSGYDLLTGLGSPLANNVVTILASAPATALSPAATPSTTGTGSTGTVTTAVLASPSPAAPTPAHLPIGDRALPFALVADVGDGAGSLLTSLMSASSTHDVRGLETRLVTLLQSLENRLQAALPTAGGAQQLTTAPVSLPTFASLEADLSALLTTWRQRDADALSDAGHESHSAHHSSDDSTADLVRLGAQAGSSGQSLDW